MLELTGKDYGLPRAPGHPAGPPAGATDPVELTKSQFEAVRPLVSKPRQPWEPRPPRARKTAA